MSIFNKKMASIVLAFSVVASMTTSLVTSANAASIDDDTVITIAQSSPMCELVYDKNSSSADTRVYDVKVTGMTSINTLTINFTTDLASGIMVAGGSEDEVTKSRFVAAKGMNFDAVSRVTVRGAKIALQLQSYVDTGDSVIPSDQCIGKLYIKLTDNVAFNMTCGKMEFNSTTFTDVVSIDTAECNKLVVSAPKYSTTPDPITQTGTQVVRHTDGKDKPAEYWVAELDPATATFNTIKVVATDSTGATAEDAKTITTLTGDAVISVHIAILNATNEVSKVDVTASYVE